MNEIEKLEKDNISAFKALKPKRKISLLKKDIEMCLKARKQGNYYKGIESQSPVFAGILAKSEYTEMLTYVRAGLRLGSLEDSELHEYVNMLEEQLDKAKKMRQDGVLKSHFDFITTGCAFAGNAVKDKEILKASIANIRQECECMLSSYFME